MLSSGFWIAFGAVFFCVKTLADAGRLLDDVRVRKCTAKGKRADVPEPCEFLEKAA